MSLSKAFNSGSHEFELFDDNTLLVTHNIQSGHNYYYDFALRMMTSTSDYDETSRVFPFDQLDREVLEALRKKLIALDGTPPALPALPVRAKEEDAPSLLSAKKPFV